MVFGSYKAKGHQQDRQIRLWSPVPDQGGEPNFIKNNII